MSARDLLAAQALIRRIPVGEQVVDAILSWCAARDPARRAARGAGEPGLGPGPRAAQALMLATRARAVLDGRLSPSVDDVLALAEPVLRHRMALSFAARADGVKLAEVIAALKASIG
jgi:MoxR-like ATPase